MPETRAARGGREPATTGPGPHARKESLVSMFLQQRRNMAKTREDRIQLAQGVLK